MKQIQMAKTSSFSLISTKKIIQMNDVWTSYDSKSYALEGVNLSIDRGCLLYTSPSPRDPKTSRMPSSA